MSKRRKKRRGGNPPQASRFEPPDDDSAAPGPPSISSRKSPRPPAPWDPMPLTELVILLGMVSAVAGWLFASGSRQVAMIVGGLGLISLASGELALREHLAGYRSHSLLLAAIPSAAVAAVCWFLWHEYALIPRQAAPIAMLATFGFAVWQLRELFKRRSGGIGFRV